MNPALVCIPTYNERENVEAITQAVLLADSRVDVLVVDDNSPDGTGQLADRLSSMQSRIQVLHRERKQGLGRAYLAAFEWALRRGYSYVLEMDADFSHHPKYLPQLIDAAGFKCFRRQVLETIDLPSVRSTGYGFQIELTYRALRKGFVVKEVPIVFEERRVGQSKMDRKIFLEALAMVWKLKFTV